MCSCSFKFFTYLFFKNKRELFFRGEEVLFMCTQCIDSKENDMAWIVELIKGEVMVPD